MNLDGQAPGVPEIMEIAIAEIELNSGIQVREAINGETVAEYAEDMKAGTPFPPVTVYRTSDHCYLADGNHRMQAALLIGRETIMAEVRKGSLRDPVSNG